MDAIVLPPAPPQKVLRMLDFYRAHREAVEPILDVPPTVAIAATEIWETMHEQARVAADAHAPDVQIRIPVSPEVVRALRWRVAHEDVFDKMMIGKLMVESRDPSWEENYALFKYFMHLAAEQVADIALPGDPAARR